MTIQEIKWAIASLAKSQGFYGRLYSQLNAESSWGELKKMVNKAKCKTSLDIVLFLEG